MSLLKKVKHILYAPIRLPVRVRFDFPNGSINNRGLLLDTALTSNAIDSFRGMVDGLAECAESEAHVQIRSTTSNGRLNDVLVDALDRGTVMEGQRGYFSVAKNGIQVVLLIPEGGKVSFTYTE